jgi:FAD/FMN-containing dehydrogenase
MHAHACQHEFCRSQFPEDLPAYIVEAKEPADIQKALSFGKSYNISVTVKTTGHSYHGASTAKDSLLIWMQNYPKNGTILDNYTSCDGNTTYHAVVSVNGGETWNDH